MLAYIEEGLWDVTLWREHSSLFHVFNFMSFSFSDKMLALLVPLLVVPQVTHYIIDGYIWRIKKKEMEWTADAGKTI